MSAATLTSTAPSGKKAGVHQLPQIGTILLDVLQHVEQE